MARTRSRSPAKRNAEQKFPIRIRIKIPEDGFSKAHDELYRRLQEAYGPHGYFIMSDMVPGQDAIAVYLPDLEGLKHLEGLGMELCLLDEMKLY